MNFKETKYLFIRSLIYLLVFFVFHFMYDWIPNIITMIFGGINESIYQHMKMGFYAYIVTMLIEFIIFRKNIENKRSYLWANLLCAILIPWIIFLVWYTSAATVGRITPEVVDIIFALIATYLSMFIISILIFPLYEIEFKNMVKIVILVLLVISIFEFTIFTFQLPWVDVFVAPVL